MLTGSGFCNNTLFAHPFCKQTLTNCIVYFVGTGIGKTFQFYVDLRTAQKLCCSWCKIKGSFTTNVVPADNFQLI